MTILSWICAGTVYTCAGRCLLLFALKIGRCRADLTFLRPFFRLQAAAAAEEKSKPPGTRTTVGASDGGPAGAFPQRNPQCLGLMVAQSSSGNVSGPWLHRFVYDPSYAEWYGRIDDPPPTCRDATSPTPGCHVDVCAPESDGSGCWHSYYKGETAGAYSEKGGLCCKGGGGCGPQNEVRPQANATFAEAKAACDALKSCSSFCFTGLDHQPAARVPVMWKSAASGFSPNPPANAPGDGNGGGSNYMEGGINNPSIFLFPNGTSLIAARTCTWPEQVVVASAPHWRGPYKSVVDGPAFGGNPNPSDEDPFLWMDIRGHMHMLLHHQDGDANQLRNGAHAYSRDGVAWTWSPSVAYTTQVAWDDGSSTALSGSISTVLTVLSSICAGIPSRRALTCPVCA